MEIRVPVNTEDSFARDISNPPQHIRKFAKIVEAEVFVDDMRPIFVLKLIDEAVAEYRIQTDYFS
jgi:hypothetical protein